MAAPEALERPLRLVRLQPRALVGDRDPREPVVALDVDRDPAFGRPAMSVGSAAETSARSPSFDRKLPIWVSDGTVPLAGEGDSVVAAGRSNV